MPNPVKFNVKGGISLTPAQVATTEDADIAPLCPNQKFSIPNTGYIDVSTYTWGYLGWCLIGYKNGLYDKWDSEGLKVVKSYWSTTVASIRADLGSDDIYKFAYIGHGEAGKLSEISHAAQTGPAPTVNEVDFINPGLYTRYGIAEMHLIGCETNQAASSWAYNVSTTGFLRTITQARGTS